MPNHTFPENTFIKAVNVRGGEFNINVSELQVELDDAAQEYGNLELQSLVSELAKRKELQSNRRVSESLLEAFTNGEVSQTAQSIRGELDNYFKAFSPSETEAYPFEIAFPFHVCGHWQVMGLRVNQDKTYQVHLFDSSTEQTNEGGIAAINDNILPILTVLNDYRSAGNGSIFYHKPYRQSGLHSVDMTTCGGSSDVTEVDPEFRTSDCGVYAMQTMSNISDFGFDEAAKNKTPDSSDGAAIVGVGAKLRAEQAVRLLVYGAENINGVLNIQDLKNRIVSQMAFDTSPLPLLIDHPQEKEGILETSLEADVGDKGNRSRTIAALSQEQNLQAPQILGQIDLLILNPAAERPTVILEVESASKDSSRTSSFHDLASPSIKPSEGSFLPTIQTKTSQAPSKELDQIWEERGATKCNIENPFPSSSVKVVTAVLMKVSNVEKSTFHGEDRGDDYKTIEGAYSEDSAEREKEVAEMMAFILSKIAYDTGVKIKNGGKNLTKDQLLGIIDYAKKKGGVKSKINKSDDANEFPLLWADENKMNKALENFGVNADLAKAVSGKYQNQCKLCGILSGRVNSNLGSRINFLTQQARAILENAVEIDGKIELILGENMPQARKAIGYDAKTVGQNIVQSVIREKSARVAKLTERTR